MSFCLLLSSREFIFSVVNELDILARYGSSSNNGSTWRSGRLVEEDSEVTRAGLIQERAHRAITYLEHEFAVRNTRLRALTARGSFLETIAYRTEINGGREPGQTNDDVILACCNHFCKDESDRLRLSGFGRNADQVMLGEQPSMFLGLYVTLWNCSVRCLRLFHVLAYWELETCSDAL